MPVVAVQPELTGFVPLALAATDWLRQTLTVTGPAEAVARFRAAAAGPGIIPWQRDLNRPGRRTGRRPWRRPPTGCRPSAWPGRRSWPGPREAVAVHQQRALLRSATDRSCPFDLHRLRPLPPAILRLGPEDPRSQAWLWTHWGTTRALRQVRELPGQTDGRRRQTGQAGGGVLVGRLVTLAGAGGAAPCLAGPELGAAAGLTPSPSMAAAATDWADPAGQDGRAPSRQSATAPRLSVDGFDGLARLSVGDWSAATGSTSRRCRSSPSPTNSSPPLRPALAGCRSSAAATGWCWPASWCC